MPLQEFWNDDPDLLWVYRTSFIKRQKQEVEYQQELINYQAWLTGYYVQMAIGSAFSKKAQYPKEPFRDKKKQKKLSKKERMIQLEEKIRHQSNTGKQIINIKEGG